MKAKRIFAYIIDFFIISCISTIIFQIAFKTNSYEEYVNKTEAYYKELVSSGSTEYTEEDLVNILYDISKAQIPLTIIQFGLTVLYFGILSFVANGKTLGKKIFNLRVVPIKGKKLNPGLYFLREIILTNSIFNLLSIINISLCGVKKWYFFNSIITNAKTVVVIILLGFLIFREDERSLHDIICKTKIVEEK